MEPDPPLHDYAERLRRACVGFALRPLMLDAAAEIERLRAYIQSLDGKTICTRCEDNTFIDDGIIVAADVLNAALEQRDT